MKKTFDAAPVLSRLKDFQRRTVDYVFQRMYLDPSPARRFLVADEVGLGKTLVARGVIARTLEHLHRRVKRIDVVYVCSNAAIAGQNVNRLNVVGTDGFAMATRLTLLPTQVHELSKRPINFISFTPGTTFDMKSRGGIVEERIILFYMLCDEPWLDRSGLRNLLQCTAGKERWRNAIGNWEGDIDPDIAAAFRKAVRKDINIRKALADLSERFHRFRENVPPEDSNPRYALIGALRHCLARTCLDALEPDLVILDEFQRFKDLLDGGSEAAELAQDLFSYNDVRVLLLSATPYKMLSLDHEQEDDHYPDFLRTMDFLFGGNGEVSTLKDEIQQFRRALYSLADGDARMVADAREALQSRLRNVMCRTERVGMTARQDAMVIEPRHSAPLKRVDLEQARLVDQVARQVNSYDVMELWKAAPYLLNFAKHYDLRRKLDSTLKRPSEQVLNALNAADSALLSRSAHDRYALIEPSNARLRSLMADTLDRGLARILWLPPSMPYLEAEGAYAEVGDITKALVFSSWQVVPDAVAALCSHEAERQMLEGMDRNLKHNELYDRIKPLLRFTRGADGRLTGMATLALIYPSPALALLTDPLRLALENGGDPLSRRVALERTIGILSERLRPLLEQATTSTAADQRWYWAAPALLDAQLFPAIREWCTNEEGWRSIGAGHEEDKSSGFYEHLEHLVEAMNGRLEPPLGRPPQDLIQVLAEVALAGPGTCALRALRRTAQGLSPAEPSLLSAAARVSGGFRTLFNLPESRALLREGDEDAYWRVILRHSLAGNLQAVLDEQVHVLQESLGVLDADPDVRVTKIGEAMGEALSLRTAQLQIEELKIEGDRIEVRPFNTRTRFALRFGELRDQEKTLARAETVRVAFNSPFRPFILASTSIGQEGLDFHTWCHAVVHWNLPSNPVDLEQREGRVHRYKGHAVRKNLAKHYGLRALCQEWTVQELREVPDPWARLFDLAARNRRPGASELEPYWIFETEGGASVERRVPLLPFSRDEEQLRRLKRGLALYRLVFGQPRQEDLLAHLADRMTEEEARAAVAAWRISLSPPEQQEESDMLKNASVGTQDRVRDAG
jgi:hypothetical protein